MNRRSPTATTAATFPAAEPSNPTERRPPADPRRAVIVNVALTVAAPLAIFYGLRACGVDLWLALVAGGVPALLHTGRIALTRRRFDTLGILTLGFLTLSAVVSLISGSPRLLLARDGWMTAFGGVVILMTLRGTPFYLSAIRSLIVGPTRERIETGYRESADVRHILRVATAIWGVGLILDAGIRLILAYTLPINVVPLASGLQYLAVFLALELGIRIYLSRAGAGLGLTD